jgi:hypothetical protein
LEISTNLSICSKYQNTIEYLKPAENKCQVGQLLSSCLEKDAIIVADYIEASKNEMLNYLEFRNIQK